jgi:nitrite reductase/ring-hydroxylating ferredoxin subunit
MAEFQEAARLEQLPPGFGTMVQVAGTDVALFNVDGTIYAMGDSCPHTGVSLGMGKLDGPIVTCRGHGLRFNVTTGQATAAPGFGVPTYPVQVIDGTILVAVDPA